MRRFLLVLVACSHHDNPPPPAPEPPPAPPPVQHMASDFGACELTVGEKTEKVTPTAAAVHYPPLAINCIGKLGRVSFSPAPGTQVTEGPHTFKVDKGVHDAVVLARAKDKQLADVEGTIDVTVFDARHIAGTFEVTGSSGTQRVTLRGTFDYPRPH